MYRPRHAKASSKHWRHRLVAAVTIAAGSLLLAAPALAAGADKWGWG